MKLIFRRLTGPSKASAVLLLCLSALIALAACVGEQTSPAVATTITATPTATQAATPEPTAGSPPAATQAPGDTPTPTPTLAPTAAPEPTATPVTTGTPAATPSPAPAPQPPATQVPTSTPSPTPTPEPVSPATPGPTSTPTLAPTATPAPSPTATPTPTVASLEIAGIEPLTSVGESVGVSVTARMTDGSGRQVARDLVQWQSSDPWVALVSEGVVTAAGGGNATVTAAYEGRTADAPVSVRISTRSMGTVRVLYAIPSDREFRADVSAGITNAIVDLQSWYRRQLDGLTFSLYETTPEECRMSQPSDLYGRYSWDKVVDGVQHCAPVRMGASNFVWVIYADVVHECGPWDEGFETLGRGGDGLTILPRHDLDGVASRTGTTTTYCGREPIYEPFERWIGGLGHELGHTFILSHPPGCDQMRDEICDPESAGSLMGYGWGKYPATYFRASDKEILARSYFINPDIEPLTGPPATLNLDPLYEKHLDAEGLPIVASSKARDLALFAARDIIDEMLALRPDLRSTIANQGVRVAVMEAGSVLTNLPEFSDFGDFSPGVSWDERTRGGGVGPTTEKPLVIIAEENLLCYTDELHPYEDIFVHEFAHAVLNMGVEQQSGGEGFRRRLKEAYEEALDAGLWENTYAGENSDEYWAEGVQSWFGLNDPPGEIHNEINTRAELEVHDPVLAGLIREVFGDVTVSASCHETVDLKKKVIIRGVVTGPGGQPIGKIGLWAWQGDETNSGHGETGADGVFDIRVPNGSFTLDVYAVSGQCSFIGWYDGAGSITTSRSQAARVIVDGTSIEGIEIRLPQNPKELPYIEWCSGG